jgi:hypothetical protein
MLPQYLVIFDLQTFFRAGLEAANAGSTRAACEGGARFLLGGEPLGNGDGRGRCGQGQTMGATADPARRLRPPCEREGSE